MKMNELWRIYGWRNIHTDEWYVGCTSRPMEERAGKNLIQYLHNCPKFAEAIKKYGPGAFEQNILRLCTTKEDAIYWEQYWIKKLNSIEHGYNINRGTIPTHPVTPHLWTEEERQIAREKALLNVYISDPRENEIWRQKYEAGLIPHEKPIRAISLEDGNVIDFPSQVAGARYLSSLKGKHWRDYYKGIKNAIRRSGTSQGFKWEAV